MEHFVDENVVMRFYLDRMEADEVEFLKGKEAVKAEIREMINGLLATSKMNDRIAIATKLWKVLFEASMSSIDKDKQGYDKLFSYFDEYVEFEELIFASDSFYRDHTLHCMWVYFLGEYIAHKGEFAPLFQSLENEYKLISLMKEAITILGVEPEGEGVKLIATVNGYGRMIQQMDAIRCVAALTHDLGYPLKKIEKINKSIRKILPFYAVESFGEFKFEYGNVSQLFIETFLKQLSTDINFTIDTDENAAEFTRELFVLDGNKMVGINRERLETATEEEKKSFTKGITCYLDVKRPFANEAAMDSDFENYQHGIMSAFLLAKNVRAFQNMYVELQPKMNLDEETYADFVCKHHILDAIAQHTCDAYKIYSLDGVAFLTFIDELEEFSRISRASQSREYVEEFCSSQIYMDDGWFCVDFTFDNDELDNLDPAKAFKGRCKRFLTLFKIPKLDENLKIRLRCIGKLEKDQSVYQLEIARKHAKIFIDGEEQCIPKYLKSTQFYTSEEYAQM